MKNKKEQIWTFPSHFCEYSVGEYDYDTHHACQSGSDCCDNDYCRCGRITNARFKSINLSSVVSEIAKTGGAENKEFFHYGIWRLAVIHKVYSPDSWELNVGGGYYGQEISGCSLENSEFKKDVEYLYQLSAQERVAFCLEKEYGFVLEKLKGKIFTQELVKVSDLVAGNDEYRKKVAPGVYDENYNLPIGIYLQDGDKFRLIDGYHKFFDCTKEKKKVEIIYAK